MADEVNGGMRIVATLRRDARYPGRLVLVDPADGRVLNKLGADDGWAEAEAHPKRHGYVLRDDGRVTRARRQSRRASEGP